MPMAKEAEPTKPAAPVSAEGGQGSQYNGVGGFKAGNTYGSRGGGENTTPVYRPQSKPGTAFGERVRQVNEKVDKLSRVNDRLNAQDKEVDTALKTARATPEAKSGRVLDRPDYAALKSRAQTQLRTGKTDPERAAREAAQKAKQDILITRAKSQEGTRKGQQVAMTQEIRRKALADKEARATSRADKAPSMENRVKASTTVAATIHHSRRIGQLEQLRHGTTPSPVEDHINRLAMASSGKQLSDAATTAGIRHKPANKKTLVGKLKGKFSPKTNS